MAKDINNSRNPHGKYKMVPPEGGWSYVITGAVSLSWIVGILPISVFGTVFGPFLASLGDETSATTLITSVFNTSVFFAGLPANHLLQNYTYRKVGLVGAVIYFVGSFLTIYATSVPYMVVTYLLQGLGFGLMYPAVLCAFNEYWVRKQTVMMSVVQVIYGIAGIVLPALTSMLLQEYGFRGTVAIFSAFTLNGILALSTLQPVKWHYKRKEIVQENSLFVVQESGEAEGGALIDKSPKEGSQNESQFLEDTNLNDMHPTGEALSTRKSLVESLDLVLFKDPIYVNMVIGISMALTSDIVFMYIMPKLLNSYGFEKADVTLILTMFFAADLMGKIALGILTAIIQIPNRHIVLTGSFFVIILRVGFTINSSFWWIATLTALLAFLKCTIQTTFPLVFAEKYGSRFPTAFSLCMVVCGIVSLLCGLLTGIVKNLSGNDIMVVHFLTGMYLCCAVPWIVEIFIKRRSNKVI